MALVILIEYKLVNNIIIFITKTITSWRCIITGPDKVMLRKFVAFASWPVNVKLLLASFEMNSPNFR